MRTLICLTLVIFLFGTTEGWSLPPCPEDQNQRLHNCFGTLTTPHGQYVGEWKDNKKHGQGTYTWANGRKYVGEWKDNKRHGQGTFTYANGSTAYVGGHKNGKWHGQGAYTDHDGRVEEGVWWNGKLEPWWKFW